MAGNASGEYLLVSAALADVVPRSHFSSSATDIFTMRLYFLRKCFGFYVVNRLRFNTRLESSGAL